MGILTAKIEIRFSGFMNESAPSSDSESADASVSQPIEPAPSQIDFRNRPANLVHHAPQHILEFFTLRQSSLDSSVPPRHICALNLTIRIQGMVITDRLLWSVFLLDPFVPNQLAQQLGFGGDTLFAYAASLLAEFGLEPTSANIAQVCASTMSQMDVVRCAVLVPDETETMERRGRGRAFDRMVKIDLPDINDFVFINAWTEDAAIREIVTTLATELSLKPAAKNAIEWTIFRAAIAHRQVFLDNFPHIQSGILRVVNAKRQETRYTAAINKQ